MHLNQDSEQFIEGYVEAALASCPECQQEDLSNEARLKIRADCLNFISLSHSLLAVASTREDYSWRHAGGDFWLSRNGNYGEGYGARKDLGPEKTILADRAWGHETSLTRSDDGKLHVSGEWRDIEEPSSSYGFCVPA